MLWVAIIAVLAYLFYIVAIKPLGYFKERNIPHNKPWPLVGSLAPIILRKLHFIEYMKKLYNEFPNSRYIGMYMFSKPQIIIRDPELIKQLTIKDFDHFMDRTAVVSEEIDPLLSKNLVALQGQRWRHMRTTLSPSFTSSKMRFMFTLLSDCAEHFCSYFQKQGSDVISVDMKDVCRRFTNDAIATTAFGVTVDSLNNKENEFFMMGKENSDIGVLQGLKFLGYTLFPAVMKFLKISVFSSRISNFFIRVIKETIEVRESKGVIRPDMVHLLLESRRGQQSNEEEHFELTEAEYAVVDESSVTKAEPNQTVTLTDVDITAQAMIFFLAGFETSSTLMTFMSYELAVNPDVQGKLQNEIDEAIERCGQKIAYEHVLGLKYLDMVVSESLRKWPPAMGLERMCVKDYVIKPELAEEEPFLIKKGLSLFIPVVAIHYDPKYFPNPDKFDPERFSEENKSNIVPFTYMPFGAGPRSCIASRFALMETKVLFFHLLSKFDLVATEKTPIPLVLSTKKIMEPAEGFWLGLRPRNVES